MEALKLNLKKGIVESVLADIPTVTNEHDVVVKVAYVGICGTDIHIIQGHFPSKDGVILGHEISGTVHQVHPDCKSFNVGDRVAVNPNAYCGSCRNCRKGLFNLCCQGAIDGAIGIKADGGWAQYVKVPIASVHKLPDSVSLKAGVLCEPLSCIIHGLEKAGKVDIGCRIVILGAGIIGILWALILFHLGHRNVVITELNEKRQKIVNNLDLGYLCADWNAISLNYDSENGTGIDFCVDCTGNVNAIDQVIPALAPGGKLLIFGVSPPGRTITIEPYEMYRKELSIIGAVVNTTQTIDAAVGIIGNLQGVEDFKRLGIAIYKLSDHSKALQDLQNGTYSKAIFEINRGD